MFRQDKSDHFKRHHKEKIKNHKCVICDYGFDNVHYLHNHINKSHKNEQNYYCDFCKKIFLLKKSYEKHVEQNHTNEMMND